MGKTQTDTETSTKLICLLVLTILSTFTTLLGRYTSIREKEAYIKSTVVVLMEGIKFVVCLFILILTEGGFSKAINVFLGQVLNHPGISLKVAVPAFLYVVQNNLLLLAYSYLDVATYQVTYQMKILTTAMFTVFIMKRSLKLPQWGSLIFLTAGVGIVTLATIQNNPSTDSPNSKSISSHKNVITTSDYLSGLALLLVASLTSGFSGVFFEKILKNSGFSLWILNVQLAFFGTILAIITCFSQDQKRISESGFFVGYDYLVWILVFIQAFGGLIVALVIKYTDNILKGFSNSISILFSAVLSYFILETYLSPVFISGAFMVIVSVMTYSCFS